MRYFIQFSYNGTHYHGWQIQPNAVTVQEVLEDRISKILGQKIQLTAAGRTDTGVHASKMLAHLDAEISDTDTLVYRLNSFLPKDIAVQRIFAVAPHAHARFDAEKRTYHYFITYHKNPFSQDTTWYWKHHSLDINAMNAACQILFRHSDFTSFSRLHTDTKTNICKIYHAAWETTNNGLQFTITADRFLRNMVRAIVGTMVEIGNHKIDSNELNRIIEKKDRKFAAASAPASGLFLAEIAYPQSIYYEEKK